MAKQTYQNIDKNLEKKDQLEEDLGKQEVKVSRLSSRIHVLAGNMREANDAVNGYRSGFQRTGSDSDRKTLQASVSNQKRIESEFNQAKSEMEAVQADLHKLKTELLSCRSEVNVSHVLEHQQRIKETEEQLQKFQQLISDQQQIISKASIPIDNTQELLNQRGDLLVEIALGTNHKKELEQLDKAIETQKEDDQRTSTTNKKIIDHAQQTVAGLEPRAASIQSQLKHLNRLTAYILNQLALGLAEELAQKYKKAANDMVKELTNLLAMEAFITEYSDGENTPLFIEGNWSMKIPKHSFMCDEECIGNSHMYYIDTARGQLKLNKEINQLKEALKKQGINLL